MSANYASLVFVVKDNRVLLAEKLSKIGKGRLNGYGGKLEGSETPVLSACREFNEETGGAIVLPEDLTLVAITRFKNISSSGEEFYWTIYVYTTNRYSGSVCRTEEMGDPEWYSVSSLPFERLLPADPYWLPQALSGKKLIVGGVYGPGLNSIIGQVKVKEVEYFVQPHLKRRS